MKVRLRFERDTNECYAKIAGKNYKFTRDKYGVLCAEVGDEAALEFVALPLNSAFSVYQDPDDIAAAKIAKAAKPAPRVMAREEPAPVQPALDQKRMASEEPLAEKKFVPGPSKVMASEEPTPDQRAERVRKERAADAGELAAEERAADKRTAKEIPAVEGEVGEVTEAGRVV